MNELEIIRNNSGKITSVKIDGTPMHVRTLIVNDSVDSRSEVTIIMDAKISGHTQ